MDESIADTETVADLSNRYVDIRNEREAKREVFEGKIRFTPINSPRLNLSSLTSCLLKTRQACPLKNTQSSSA